MSPVTRLFCTDYCFSFSALTLGWAAGRASGLKKQSGGVLTWLFVWSKVQIGFTFLVPAHPGSPGQMSVKRVCVCV